MRNRIFNFKNLTLLCFLAIIATLFLPWRDYYVDQQLTTVVYGTAVFKFGAGWLGLILMVLAIFINFHWNSIRLAIGSIGAILLMLTQFASVMIVGMPRYFEIFLGIEWWYYLDFGYSFEFVHYGYYLSIGLTLCYFLSLTVYSLKSKDKRRRRHSRTNTSVI